MLPQPEPDDETREQTAAPDTFPFAAVATGFRMCSAAAASPESAPKFGHHIRCDMNI
jgi:hypothetical protein